MSELNNSYIKQISSSSKKKREIVKAHKNKREFSILLSQIKGIDKLKNLNIVNFKENLLESNQHKAKKIQLKPWKKLLLSEN